MMPKKPWTTVEVARLRTLYPDLPCKEIAHRLGRSLSSINNAATTYQLKKSAAFLSSYGKRLHASGLSHRFPRGQSPWNKGRPHPASGRAATTQFKKGQAPHTTLQIGSERRDKDGILWRKVNDDDNRRRRWQAVHVIAWESVNGKLPAGKVVIFSDRNRDNFNPANLLAVTRAELMQRNSYHNRYPKAIGDLMQLRGVLTRKINQRRREREEQNR